MSGEWASILVAIAIYGRAGSGQWIIVHMHGFEERPGALSPMVGVCTGNRGIGETGADLC